MNPYEIHGIAEGASPDEIKAAYLEKARRYHPDTGGDAWAFRQVEAAYQKLMNGKAAKEQPAKTGAAATSGQQSDTAKTKAAGFHGSSFRFVIVIGIVLVAIATGVVVFLVLRRETGSGSKFTQRPDIHPASETAAQNDAPPHPPQHSATRTAGVVSPKPPSKPIAEEKITPPAASELNAPHNANGALAQSSGEDSLAEKLDALLELAEAASSAAEYRTLSERALVLADEALASRRFEVASPAASAALGAARHAEDSDLVRRATFCVLKTQNMACSAEGESP